MKSWKCHGRVTEPFLMGEKGRDDRGDAVKELLTELLAEQFRSRGGTGREAASSALSFRGTALSCKRENDRELILGWRKRRNGRPASGDSARETEEAQKTETNAGTKILGTD